MKQIKMDFGQDCFFVHIIREFMTGLIAFLIFWVVFGIGYLSRDKSKDQEKLEHFGH